MYKPGDRIRYTSGSILHDVPSFIYGIATSKEDVDKHWGKGTFENAGPGVVWGFWSGQPHPTHVGKDMVTLVAHKLRFNYPSWF